MVDDVDVVFFFDVEGYGIEDDFGWIFEMEGFCFEKMCYIFFRVVVLG